MYCFGITFSLFLLSFTAVANQEIISNSYFNYMETEEKILETNTDHQIDMSIVLDVDSKWADQKVFDRHISLTQKSLGVCGIAIKKLEIIKVKLPQKFKDQLLISNPYLGLPEIPLAKEGLPKRDLLGFLFQKVKPYGSAFAINLDSVINSERTTQFPSYRPLLGTFWVSEESVDYRRTPRADSTYSTVAHEVVHIMGNLGHIGDNQSPNLMSSSDHVGKSYHLNDKQCQAIVSHFFQ